MGRKHLVQLPVEDSSLTLGSSQNVNLTTGILDRVEARYEAM